MSALYDRYYYDNTENDGFEGSKLESSKKTILEMIENHLNDDDMESTF